MRVLIQRVIEASVTIDGKVTGSIGRGLLMFLGIEDADGEADVLWLAGKVARMRLFSDSEGQINLSLAEAGGEALVVSQFTLHASTKKGNRPSFIRAARPEKAIPLYEKFIDLLERETGKRPASGEFGADMKVALINNGPVTIWVDSRMRE